MLYEDKILTLHPAGRRGVNILKRRYDVIKDFIINALEEKDEIAFKTLSNRAVKKLKSTFDAKVEWYFLIVKQDLEARDVVEDVPDIIPLKIRLKKKEK